MESLFKRVVVWLGVLLAASVIVQVSAQLITPIRPLLVTLFAIAISAYWVFFKRRP
ncbi:MAG TPA: hypothetical protein VIV12_06595 [Streptosporangiaceae bacterium]